MAGFSKDNKGNRITFTINGCRKCVRPGQKVTDEDCSVIKSHIEELVVAYSLDRHASRKTLDWLDSISDRMHLKISRTGLIEHRDSDNPFKGLPTVGGLQSEIIELKKKIRSLESQLEDLMQCTKIEIIDNDKKRNTRRNPQPKTLAQLERR